MAPKGFFLGPANRQLRQSLLLAVLLHCWLILTFGHVSGTAPPGEGLWGRINVRLSGQQQGVAAESPGKTAPTMSAAPAGPVGQAKRERFGGTVRPLEKEASKTPPAERVLTPGAAELGAWSERRVDAPEPLVDRAPAPAAPAAQAAPSPVMMTMAAPAAALTPLRATDLRALSAAPAAALSAQALGPLPSAKVKVMESASASSSREAGPLARPLELPRKLQSQPALPPGPLPALPVGVAAPLPSPEALPLAPALPEPAPEPPKHLLAPVELKRLQPSEALALPSAPVAPAPLAALAASAVPPSPAMSPTPATPGAVTLAAPAPALSAVAPKPSTAGTVAAPVTEAGAAAAAATAAASLAPALPRPGSPEAGPRLGVDVATPPSAPADRPRLNLNLPRPQGGELARRGSSGVLQMMPAPPEIKSKLSEDMEKARREDCRKAYGEQLGLLAVVPLVLDAARSNNKGCRW